MEFVIHNLAPIMFAGLILFLLVGFPVAFSLGACGLFFAFVGIELGGDSCGWLARDCERAGRRARSKPGAQAQAVRAAAAVTTVSF